MNDEIDDLNWSHLGAFKKYMSRKLSELSDNEIILGMIAGFKKDACNAAHHEAFADHLPTDECRIFRYPNGYGDHYNMRFFDEWIINNKPHLYDKIYGLKAFW